MQNSCKGKFSQKVLGLVLGGSFLLVAGTAFATDHPDLTAAKTNNLGGAHATAGSAFNWTITVTNGGSKDTTPGNGVVLLKDELPTSGATYGSPIITAVSNVEHSDHISCSIVSNVLTCSTTSGDVKMKDPTGTFSVRFSVTPTTSGTLTNPRNGGTCKADPDDRIDEGSNENNNTCSNSVIVNPGTATLTVTKVVTNNNGGTKVVSDFPLFLDGMAITSGVATTTSTGPHTISETNQAGYTGTISGNCAANGTITLGAGDNKSCTITNDDQPGHLTIVKNTVGDDGLFLFTVSGSSASTPSIQTSGLTGTTGALAVNAGTYSVAEGGQGSWDLTSATCNDGSSSLSGSTVSSIDVSLGANVTCTFTNTKRGSITVSKNVVAPDGTTDVSDDHEFHVTLNGADQKTVSEGKSKTYSNLIPGTYTVAEITGDPDFDLLRITANGDEDPTPQDGAPVTVTAGQDTEVIITNAQKQGSLTIKKVVTNPNGGTAVAGDFSFTLNGGGPVQFIQNLFNSLLGENNLSVDPGSYTVAETPPEGVYAISYDNCSNIAVGSNGQPSTATTCTITNSDIPTGQGAITVIKDPINNNGGELGAGDFTLNITPEEDDTFEVTSGQANFLTPGNYSVSEGELPEGYLQTSINCTNGETETTDGSVTLGEQDAWTCTITNDDQPGTLHVVKTVINDNGGTNTASDFSFQVNGTGDSYSFINNNEGGLSGSKDVTVNAGTYSVDENETAGYTTTYDGCSEMDISNGGSATCTITNNDKPVHLTIVKHTDEQSGDGSFSFNVLNGEVSATDGPVVLNTEDWNASSGSIQLNAGSYDVTESVPEGWTLSSVRCEYGNEGTGSNISNGKHITLPNGRSVTCTFTDTKRATLTVKKIVINDNDGTKHASDFSFQVNEGSATAFSSGENNLLGENNVVVNAGTYSVTEPSAEGYSTTYDNCSQIVLANGGHATCTITNNDIAPTPPPPPPPPSDDNGGSNGPIGGVSFGFGGGNGGGEGSVLGASFENGMVLGAEMTKEEQIAALKAQIEKLKKRLEELLRGKVSELKEKIIAAIRHRISDLEEKVRQLHASH